MKKLLILIYLFFLIFNINLSYSEDVNTKEKVESNTEEIKQENKENIDKKEIKNLKSSFLLWERSITINFLDASNTTWKKETTVLIDNTLYKNSYYINDYNTIEGSINFIYSNLHCDFKWKININKRSKSNTIDLLFWYDKQWNCIYKVSQEKEYWKFIDIKITNKSDYITIVSLNDLWYLDYLAILILWIVVTIIYWIHLIVKKKILIYNK